MLIVSLLGDLETPQKKGKALSFSEEWCVRVGVRQGDDVV
jgi:hypothetical protein